MVPGGGVTLLRAIPAVKAMFETLHGDEATGAKIVMRALEEPARQIAINAGFEGSVVVNAILSGGTGNYGFNAATGEYGDLMSFGIVDPAKVTRTALQNAASIGSLILTTEAVIADKPERKEAHSHAPAGPGGMGGDMDF